MREKLKDRFNILAISFILIAAIITLQLTNLQIIHGQENDEKSQRKLLSNRKIPAPRGNILDRYGVPIAVNRQAFTVQIVKTKTPLKELNAMLLKLANIFEKNNDTYYKGLSKYLILNNAMEFGSTVKQSENKIAKIKNDIGIKSRDFDTLSTPDEAFQFLRKKVFEIEDSYSVVEAYKIMTFKFEMLIKGYTALNPLTLAKDVSKETVAEVEERHSEFPGVTTDVEPIRDYMDAGILAHTIGYVGVIDQETYSRKKDEGYDMNDVIGKTGVEYAAESYLKGKPGVKRIEMDAAGRTTEELDENSAIPGNDVVLTIDTKLQKVAMESLERNINRIRTTDVDYKKNFGDATAGAAVAIDVTNGEILAMASYPSYDPSIFLAGSDDRDAQSKISQLMSDKVNKPMLNRATQEIYAPGSTYKPITAIAALEEGVITPWTKILDEGKTNIGGRDFVCLEYRDYGWAHGYLQLDKALATSCNIYFHKVGFNTGIDNIDKWAKAFGLGEPTGIDVGREEKGIRSNKEYKKTAYKDDWRPADTAQSSIGQLYNAFTPLQIANYVSSLANGGKKFQPHMIKRVVKNDGSVVEEFTPKFEQIPSKKETIDAVKEGMVAVTNADDGTAVNMFNDLVFNGKKVQVAGKTGTAETAGSEIKRSSNALFISYAPADDPKIAVAVVIERGVWGSNTAPVAKDILAEYFNMTSRSDVDDSIKGDEVVFTR